MAPRLDPQLDNVPDETEANHIDSDVWDLELSSSEFIIGLSVVPPVVTLCKHTYQTAKP